MEPQDFTSQQPSGNRPSTGSEHPRRDDNGNVRVPQFQYPPGGNNSSSSSRSTGVEFPTRDDSRDFRASPPSGPYIGGGGFHADDAGHRLSNNAQSRPSAFHHPSLTKTTSLPDRQLGSGVETSPREDPRVVSLLSTPGSKDPGSSSYRKFNGDVDAVPLGAEEGRSGGGGGGGGGVPEYYSRELADSAGERNAREGVMDRSEPSAEYVNKEKGDNKMANPYTKQRRAGDATNANNSLQDRATNTAQGLGRPPMATSTASTNTNDSTDGLFGKPDNAYERLDRQRPTSQHLYRPIINTTTTNNNNNTYNNPSATTVGMKAPSALTASTIVTPCTSTAGPLVPLLVSSSRPAPGATSPLYHTRTVPSQNAASQAPRPSLQHPHRHQPSNGRHAPHPPYRPRGQGDSGDEIIELQSDINTINNGRSHAASSSSSSATAAAAAQNKANAKKVGLGGFEEVTDIPNTNFAIACMVAVCCNLPFGILAMYLSLKAVKDYQDGQRKCGARRSRWSIIVSLLGITVTTCIVSSVVLYFAMQGQKRISQQQQSFGGGKSGLNL